MIHYFDSDFVEILDALKNNTVVKMVTFYTQTLGDQEALAKLSEVMKCNKSVTYLTISLERGILLESLFAAMATSGGWSSIQELDLFYEDEFEPNEPLSLREAELFSSFII